MNFRPSARLARGGSIKLEMTSMIDVIFLLLVYFILSTTYQPPESQLAPALRTQSDTAGRSMDLTPQIVEVGIHRGSPGFAVGSRVMRTKEELSALLKELPRDAGVIVRGSPAASVGLVATGLQAARDAGFTRVTYVPAR